MFLLFNYASPVELRCGLLYICLYVRLSRLVMLRLEREEIQN